MHFIGSHRPRRSCSRGLVTGTPTDAPPARLYCKAYLYVLKYKPQGSTDTRRRWAYLARSTLINHLRLKISIGNLFFFTKKDFIFKKDFFFKDFFKFVLNADESSST